MGACAALDELRAGSRASDALEAALARASEPPCPPTSPVVRKRRRADGPSNGGCSAAERRLRKRRALALLRRAGHEDHRALTLSDEEDAAAPGAAPQQQPQQLPAAAPGAGSPLHREILAFAEAASLTPAEHKLRERALDALRAVVHTLWPDALVCLFGSTATGLALPSSDLDVVVFGVPGAEELEASAGGAFTVAQRARALALLGRLKRALQAAGVVGGAARVISAKVPILKCVTATGGFPCDLSFGVANGAAAVPLVSDLAATYPALRPLTLVLKSFLAQRSLHSPWTGGIGGYALLSLVTAHLQSHPPADLGDALHGFFRRYASFDVRRSAISIMRGGVVPKPPPRVFALAVEDPQEPGKDIGAAAFNFREARAAFAAAAAQLAGHREAGRAGASAEAGMWATVQADGHTHAAQAEAPSLLGRIICVRKALRRRPLALSQPQPEAPAAAEGGSGTQRAPTGGKGHAKGGKARAAAAQTNAQQAAAARRGPQPR
jgi:non-canonical poly(A) RNA polymerase PAPD5/7